MTMSTQNSFPEQAVIILSNERSGSTWLLDALRCHPSIYIEPSAKFYKTFCVKGRRYPVDLSNEADGALNIEVTPSNWEKIPDFSIPSAKDLVPQAILKKHYAIEKWHPHFFSNPLEFQAKVKSVQKKCKIKFITLLRDPKESMTSFLNYRLRRPEWNNHIQTKDLPYYMKSAYDMIVNFCFESECLMIDYSDLRNDFTKTMKNIFLYLWNDEYSTYGKDLSLLIDMIKIKTSRKERLKKITTPFFVDGGERIRISSVADGSEHESDIKRIYLPYNLFTVLNKEEAKGYFQRSIDNKINHYIREIVQLNHENNLLKEELNHERTMSAARAKESERFSERLLKIIQDKEDFIYRKGIGYRESIQYSPFEKEYSYETGLILKLFGNRKGTIMEVLSEAGCFLQSFIDLGWLAYEIQASDGFEVSREYLHQNSIEQIDVLKISMKNFSFVKGLFFKEIFPEFIFFPFDHAKMDLNAIDNSISKLLQKQYRLLMLQTPSFTGSERYFEQIPDVDDVSVYSMKNISGHVVAIKKPSLYFKFAQFVNELSPCGKTKFSTSFIESAIEYFRRKRDQHTENGEVYKSMDAALDVLAFISEAKDYEKLYHIGLKLNQSKDLSSAVDVYERVSSDVKTPPSLAAWALFKHGELFFDMGDKKKAIVFFNKALMYNPDHIKARLFLVPGEDKIRVAIGDSFYCKNCIEIPMSPLDDKMWNYYFNIQKPDYIELQFDYSQIDKQLEKLLTLIKKNSKPNGIIIMRCNPVKNQNDVIHLSKRIQNFGLKVEVMGNGLLGISQREKISESLGRWDKNNG